ncbi:R3H domain-containing protein 4-like [Tropilaelaps mercedesae]|uniref:R3H domain-containing protein 4-like n=1 Tax=Tropilaelaps mercedesae TaxID=418985 RepID=A0A1V9XTI7_9ACAR|nr:R3H domain-containing protein 4-like [Tropilaelaps mercedesae]
MDVIRGIRNYCDSLSEVEAEEECSLSDKIESADDSCLVLHTLDFYARNLSSRSIHKGRRKQRRLQNETQLRALCELDDDLQAISIYDFIGDSISAFALILQEKDNIALWNAMLTAEANDEDACDDIGLGKKSFAENSMRNLRMESKRRHPAALTPEDCYRRLDSDMRRTLRRHRCPTDMMRTIEEQLETFFTVRIVKG